ncbi:MAG: C40 family peptidase [Chloroflexota bacterium]|nr:C40 family peptidase [Chloroflexota bacterium]
MSLSKVLAATAVAGLSTALVGFVTVASAVGGSSPEPGPVCATSGPISGLSTAQAQNARIVAAAATSRGGSRAALIALMTGLAESDLLVLANPNDPAGGAFPSQGVGHDHDSLGIFQQRPGWGTAAQRMDPIGSTNLFVGALLARDGWDAVEPWRAAQDVQRSAFDGRPLPANGFSPVFGGNYLAQIGRARALLDVIQIGADKLDCGGGNGDPPAGFLDPSGLPATYELPPTTTTPARIAVTFALAQRGKPYLWGGTGPDGYDCSGLMLQAWVRAGHRLGRTTWDQIKAGTPTSQSALQPGDLLLTPGSDGTLASPGHVGMFIGHGLVIHAPRTGDVIKVVTFSSFTANGISDLRHIA